MAHAIFQAPSLAPPVNTQNRQVSAKHLGPIVLAVRPVSAKLGRFLALKCSASSYSSSSSREYSVGSLERCLIASEAPPSSFEPVSSSGYSGSGPMMKKKGRDSGGFGAVTLKKKVDLPQKLAKQILTIPELETGGGGGGIGKKINHGGGDGGDDDDEDDYYDDFDDEEGEEAGLFRRRKFLKELFERKFVDSVLYEWQKAMMDLPAGLRQAYEMGLVSSAHMVRYMAINARPTTTRFISRALPQAISRAFIGRMIADPAFLYKLLLEQAATIGCSLWWEVKTRKERLKQEWDLALINVLTASACNAFAVWSVAPSRSYGNTFRFDLQNTLQKLPNNMFEQSYPLREFDMQKRFQSFIYRTVEMTIVGLGAGAMQGGLTDLLARKKKQRLSVTTPTLSTNALGYASFLGFYSNLRYQLLCGVDRAMMSHFDVIGLGLFFSTALRVMNVELGERSRRVFLGVEADPLYQSGDNFSRSAHALNSETNSESSSKWFVSKNSIVSGLGRLGFRQEQANGEAPAPKPRRKRIVRKKAASSSSA